MTDHPQTDRSFFSCIHLDLSGIACTELHNCQEMFHKEGFDHGYDQSATYVFDSLIGLLG